MVRYRLWSIGFMILSLLGIFGPWFYFVKSVDYRTGWGTDIAFIIVGFFIYFLMIWINDCDKRIRITVLVGNLIVITSCIYEFLTWHIMTITGELDLRVSFTTTHWGFYMTLICAVVSSIIYTVGIIKSRV
ncbi:MAG: hypothetical protein RR840_02280 [Clostridium sp.]